MEKLNSGEKRDTLTPAEALCVTLSACGPPPRVGEKENMSERKSCEIIPMVTGMRSAANGITREPKN